MDIRTSSYWTYKDTHPMVRCDIKTSSIPYAGSSSFGYGPMASKFRSAYGSLKNDVSWNRESLYGPITKGHIIDQIVSTCNRPAFDSLRRALRYGTAEEKQNIVEATIAQAYPLMFNSLGNIVVQQCFIYGTQKQINNIADIICRNMLILSMDRFGWHVVQRAFEVVPTEYKAIMVHELLRIPETIFDCYAGRVWQKIFQLHWAEFIPRMMEYLNNAFSGKWHAVALIEQGSLVIQSIFENCIERHKVSGFV
jgi:Pumilio-family RNA binding repeat